MLLRTLVVLNILLIVFISTYALAEDGDDKPENRLASEIKERCDTTKEFVTAYEYLKNHDEYGLNENNKFKVAKEIAAGCTGAASRFARAFELLLKAEAGPRSSLNIAINLANKTQEYSDTFVLVFTRSFLAEYLDLDYKTSFELAKRLSVDYTGNPKIAAKDFVNLVDFCTSEKEAGLSKPICGVLAGRVLQKTEKFRALMSDEFIKVYHFMTAENGASGPVYKALTVAENIVAQGPEAADNFVTAYKYAINRDGLGFTAENSLKFAQKIAQNTWFNSHDHPVMWHPLEEPGSYNNDENSSVTADGTIQEPAKKTTKVRAPADTSSH